MKWVNIKMAAAGSMLAAAVALAGCGSQASEPATTQEQEAQAVDPQLATAAYRCPMGCAGSASIKPGKCPVCEMALERNPNYKPAADSP